MAFPAKPGNWAIEPGRGWLRGASPIVSEVSDRAGMTESDRLRCENIAWRELICSLADVFDVSDWGEEPPEPLGDWWERLASAYYLAMDIGIEADSSSERATAPRRWIDEVRKLVQEAANPQGGIWLMKRDGTIVRPRARTMEPSVASPELTFFPALDDEQSRHFSYIGGSLEEFQKRHGRYSNVIDRHTLL